MDDLARSSSSKGGKPHFVAGPDDNPLRCSEILYRLERHCGQGGYHYTIPLRGVVPDVDEDFDQIDTDDVADD